MRQVQPFMIALLIFEELFEDGAFLYQQAKERRPFYEFLVSICGKNRGLPCLVRWRDI